MIHLKLGLYWLGAFILAAVILSNSHYKSRNDDSNYYTDLVVRYQNDSWQNMLTPIWGKNCYGFDPKSYMKDQFPGQLILGISLTKLKIPADQALHILEMAFQILSIVLLFKIALLFISYENASVLLYGLVLTPMAFSYNIRANHEAGIMFFSLLSLWAGLNLSSLKRWSVVAIVSNVMLLMIKGPFFIFGLAFFIIGYLFSKNKSSLKRLLVTVFLSGLTVFCFSYGYELLYLKITGQSFFLEFYKIQILNRALQKPSEHFFIIQKIINFYYYFSHYLIYALPWSAIAVILFFKNKKKQDYINQLKLFLKSPLGNCLLLSSLVYGLVFSLSDRTATRYVFPAYYIFSAWVILLIFHSSSKMRAFHFFINQKMGEIIAPALWFIAFAIHFVNGH